MKWTLRPTGSGRTRRTLFGAIGSLLLLGVIAVPNAAAVHDLGLFELDRNAEDQVAGGDDWNTLPGGGEDDFSGILADIGADGGTQFQGGGSKDDLNISSWLWKPGEPLDKDDITNAYAAAYTNTTDTLNSDVGDLIVYFGLDRFSTAGSAQVGFWFLQDPAFGLSNTPSGGGFKFNGLHVDGDILVQSNFSNGGVISNLAVFQWQSGALVPVPDVPNPSECNPASPPPLVDDTACATVNQASTPAPWPYTPKANEGAPGTFQTSAFFEGGINITQLIPDAGCFTAFTAETRSSTPFDARLKDFVIGDLDTCVRDVSVEKTPDGGTANAGDTITFSITVTNESPNSDAENVTLTDTLPNSGLNWSITTQPADLPCSIAGTPQVLSCNFGTLGVGESRTVEISSPTDAADCGTKNNTVTVSATGDIDATNNTDTGDITVNCGAIRINKNSTKGDGTSPVSNAGAVFSITGPGISGTLSVTDDLTAAAPDEDANVGRVCVSGLQPGGTYTVNETSPPSGYAGATQVNQTVVAVAGDCTSGSLNAATFTNVPLGEITTGYNDGGSNETSATSITCAPQGGADLTAQPEASDDDIPDYDADSSFTVTAPGTYVCTVVVDP